MIEPKPNKCKGQNKAINFNGCGQILIRYKYGLCRDCFFKWLNSTDEGEKHQMKLIKSTLNKVRNDKPKRKYIKWQDKPTNEMITYVQDELCNPYIRFRDIESGYRCISSGGVIEHAGHCFSVGQAPGLRFNIMNIHGQQAKANTHLHGDFQNYKEGLIKRHGIKYFEKLEQLKVNANKIKQLDRQEVIRIGTTYKWLLDNKQICFKHEEFENYKNILNK